MRTTLDLPEDLVNEAMKVTRIKTKTGVISEEATIPRCSIFRCT